MAIIFTDGRCLNNGQANPKAGWGFHHGIIPSGQPALANSRLEKQGPVDNSIREQTSNCAELRAIIAVLRFRHWPGEGFKTLVIATDSSYAVDGATKWCKMWLKNGWKTSQPGTSDVKNRDLWEALLGEAERAQDKGLTVSLWQIPRELNTVADGAAKSAAREDDGPDDWTEMMGINV